MENSVTEMKNNSMQVRDISVITAEIKDINRQAQNLALIYAVEMGRRLEEAKSMLSHGEWGDWIKREFEFSQSSANNYMKLYKEFGASQISLFGASVNSQAFANLSYSKALQLLAIPKEEREEFAEAVNAEDLSVRQLKAAISERDEAIKKQKEAEAREKALSDKLIEAEGKAIEANVKATAVDDIRKELDKEISERAKAQENVKELQKKLKDAKKNPSIPKEKLDELRAEVEAAVRKEAELNASKAIKEVEDRLKAAEIEAEAAKRAAEEADARLEAAKKQLRTASPEVTTFKTLFNTVQETVLKLKDIIKKVRLDDADTADRLDKALIMFGSSLVPPEESEK